MTFDADGNVLSVSVPEPRFTAQEIALLLASRREENLPRGKHGWLLSDATDPANMGQIEVPLPMTDFVAKALSEAQDEWREANGDKAGLEYLLWSSQKKA